MRDPTRGGLATTLNEMAKQSGVSIRISKIRFLSGMPSVPPAKCSASTRFMWPTKVKLMAIVAPEKADGILNVIKLNRYGAESAIIGEVTADHPGRVVMRTRLGASRIIDMLSGELLPRIC